MGGTAHHVRQFARRLGATPRWDRKVIRAAKDALKKWSDKYDPDIIASFFTDYDARQNKHEPTLYWITGKDGARAARRSLARQKWVERVDTVHDTNLDRWTVYVRIAV